MPERHPFADDVVDPRLQGGRDVVVVDGRGNDEVIGRQQFGREFIRQAQHLLHLGGVPLGQGEVGLKPGSVHEGQVGLHQIALDDPPAGMRRPPPLDEASREVARDGIVAAGAGLDDEEAGHGCSLLRGLPARRRRPLHFGPAAPLEGARLTGRPVCNLSLGYRLEKR